MSTSNRSGERATLGACTLLMCGCYSVDRVPLPDPTPAEPGRYVTLLGWGDEGVFLADTSSSSDTTVYYGAEESTPLSLWHPIGVRVIAMQFPATALKADGVPVAPHEVTPSRTAQCAATCGVYLDLYELENGTPCSKYWDGGPTEHFRFYDWADGVWSARIGEKTDSGVDIDDIVCSFALEIREP